ncbi:MAG: hypothetical protein KC646_11105 [Candidatus Cloacimonetes bacterium]|nr:hypothetical protein [Candidatus Cloacimonadota bacterium]
MKTLFTIPISKYFLSKRLEVLTQEHSKHLSFEVQNNLWFGQVQMLNEGKIYEVDFQLFDVYLENINDKLCLNVNFAKIPEVNVEGDFFEELGSSILNVITKAVSIEQVLSLSKVKVDGLVAIENEISYQVQDGRVPFIAQWFFDQGLSLLVEPNNDGLKLSFNLMTQKQVENT